MILGIIISCTGRHPISSRVTAPRGQGKDLRSGLGRGVQYLTSPKEPIELCLSRSGGLPPAGESDVADDNDARTARSSEGVPGESGALAPASEPYQTWVRREHQ